MITIGVVTPHAAAGPDVELPDMAAGRVATRVTRIPAPGATESAPGTPPATPVGLRALTAPAALDEAVAALPPGSVDAIAAASTSTGYVIGLDAETAMLERLSRRWAVPVAGASTSAIAALRSLRVRRVSVVHPPWFDAEMNALGATYFRRQGFEVVSSASADLVNDPSRIEPGAITEWICRRVRDDADAVFIGGTGFRAARSIEALEERLERPVLESNQVLLWALLGAVRADLEIRGYGRLYAHRRDTVPFPREAGGAETG
jgi:maleate isomerase